MNKFKNAVSIYVGEDRIVMFPDAGAPGLISATQDPIICLTRPVTDQLLGESVAFCFRSSRLIRDEPERSRRAELTAATLKKVFGSRSDRDLTRKAIALSLSELDGDLSIFRWGVHPDGYFGGQETTDPIPLDHSVFDQPLELAAVIRGLVDEEA